MNRPDLQGDLRAAALGLALGLAAAIGLVLHHELERRAAAQPQFIGKESK